MSKFLNYLDEYKASKDFFEKNKNKGIRRFGYKFLEKFAKNQGQDKFYGLFIKRILNILNINLNSYENFKILEIGCGSGWAMSFQSSKVKYIAIDKYDNYKDFFNSKGIDFFKCDIEKEDLPLEENSINLVLMNHVIEHIKDPDILLIKLKKIIKKNGYLYIRCPDIELVKNKFWNDYTHVKPYTKLSIKQLHDVHSFKKVFLINSDWRTIQFDILSKGKLRDFLFSKIFSIFFRKNNEIECAFENNKN